MNKVLFIVGFAVSLVSCSNTHTYRDFTVTAFREIDSDYHYSKDTITFAQKEYMPVYAAEYANGNLFSFSLYKSEGRITYSADDLSNDTLVGAYYGIPGADSIMVERDFIEFRGKKLQKAKSNSKHMYCLTDTSLYIFVIGKPKK